MSGWAAAAQVAAEIADKFIDSRSASSAAAQSSKGRQFTIDMTKSNRQFAVDMYKRQLKDQDTRRNKRLQEIVADAEKAGLHPLFALGQGGSGGSPISIPGVSTPSPGGGGSGSRSNIGGGVASALARSRDTQLDKMAAEAHAVRMQRERIAAKRDEIALLSESNQSMRLQQELTRNPTAARAFSQAATRADRVGALNQEFADRLAVTTPAGATFTGPYGGKWEIPPGVTPQEIWEMLLGETGELAGIGIGSRMAIGQDKMERKRKAHNRAVRKKRAKKRREGARKIQKQIRRSPRRNW